MATQSIVPAVPAVFVPSMTPAPTARRIGGHPGPTVVPFGEAGSMDGSLVIAWAMLNWKDHMTFDQ